MKQMFNRFLDKFRGHVWVNDNVYPLHGYHNEPNPLSYCKRCKFRFKK